MGTTSRGRYFRPSTVLQPVQRRRADTASSSSLLRTNDRVPVKDAASSGVGANHPFPILIPIPDRCLGNHLISVRTARRCQQPHLPRPAQTGCPRRPGVGGARFDAPERLRPTHADVVPLFAVAWTPHPHHARTH